MYLYYANTTDLMISSLRRAKEDFSHIPIEERINNTLLNLGLRTTNQGFSFISQMIAERIKEYPKTKITRVSGITASHASYAIKYAFSTTNLALNREFLSASTTTKNFLYFVAEFLKENEDFKWYYQVHNLSISRLAISLQKPLYCSGHYARYIDIDTRIETLLDKIGVTNLVYRRYWLALIKECYLGEYTCLKNNYLCSMGFKYITIYQNLAKSFKIMINCPEYISIVQEVTFDPPSMECHNIESVAFILASYLRRKLDALWYLQ